MRIFFDTNVVLDLLASREPFAESAELALDAVERPGNTGVISALTVCDVVYILRKQLSAEEVGLRMKALAEVLSIADVRGCDVMAAFDKATPDYEDTVQSLTAHAARADVIVTRNPDDFAATEIRVMTPYAFIQEFCRDVSSADDI